MTFRTGVARMPGIGGLVLRASLGPIFSDETTSRLNGQIPVAEKVALTVSGRMPR